MKENDQSVQNKHKCGYKNILIYEGDVKVPVSKRTAEVIQHIVQPHLQVVQ